MPNAQILLVEDENIVAMDVRNRLQGMGYNVAAVAPSGEQALEKAAETVPDVVLMDIVLKGSLDGVQTGEAIRKRFDIPVIYLTAYGDDATLNRAKLTEPYGYLLKPYEERELFTTIEIALYRHRLERKIKETERWHAATFRSVGDGIIVTDAACKIRSINPLACEWTGWSAEEALGRELLDVFQIQDERTRLLPDSRLFPSCSEGPVQLAPHTLLGVKGHGTVPIEGTIAALEDDQGTLTGYVLAFRDVSERNRMEHVTHRLEQYLADVRKTTAINQLAAGVALEFDDLLTVILGNVSLVLSNLSERDPNREALAAAESASMQAADRIKQFLICARRSVMKRERLDLRKVVERCLESMMPRRGQDVAVRCRAGRELWPVIGDRDNLNGALMNLVRNSEEAMPVGGTIEIDIDNLEIGEEVLATRPHQRPGSFVRLRIRDTGHGITEDIRPRIFDPFFTTKKESKGSGLGLVLVKGIVEQHDGWIEFVDLDAPGACFDVYLPRAEETGTSRQD